MAISLTIFDSIYDNKTEKRMDYNAWSEFETVLYRLASQDKYKVKTDAPLISPAVYKDDTTRANDNVTGWGGWAAYVRPARRGRAPRGAGPARRGCTRRLRQLTNT